MSKVVLTDGTEIPATYCGAAQGFLWIELEEPLSVYEAATLFKDSEKLSPIVFRMESKDITYEGYTELQRVQIDSVEGHTEVTLKRGEAT